MRPVGIESATGMRAASSLEEEKLRIARAIHDSVTQELSVIIWQLRLACAHESTNEADAGLRRALCAAEASMEQLRRLMGRLRTPRTRAGMVQ
jgi:signal transduction histidine kinase